MAYDTAPGPSAELDQLIEEVIAIDLKVRDWNASRLPMWEDRHAERAWDQEITYEAVVTIIDEEDITNGV